jgi:PhoH-like ATPase
MSDKKTFILDTNVLLSDTDAFHAFEENDIIVPLAVIEELDNQKSRQDEVGKNARVVTRHLDELRKLGNLHGGIKLPTGGTLRVMATHADTKLDLPGELDCTKVDNIIIAFTYQLTKSGQKCTLVSKDLNVRIKCDTLGIKAEDYLKMRIADTKDEMYRGVSKITMSEESIDSFYHNEPVFLPTEMREQKLFYPNEILVIKDPGETKSAIARFVAPDQPIRQITKVKDVFGLVPRNKEQSFSLDLLLDDNVKLVSLVGSAGTGKTLLAVAAGLHQVLGGSGRYDKLIISRPVQPVGRDIGFLPGTLEEKMDPWIAPIKDNLNFLVGGKFGSQGQGPPANKKFRNKKDGDDYTAEFKQDPYLQKLFENGRIEVEAIAFIRGRSIPNSFIIIDEAQNLSIHELKTIITRVGDGTKIVLTGDIEQIDNVHVDVFTNGLTYAIEKFKEYDIAGHITLIKGERSVLATLASKIL